MSVPTRSPAPPLPAGYRFESDPAAVQARMGNIHAALNDASIYWGRDRSEAVLAKQFRQSWRAVLILYDGNDKEGELAAVVRVVGDGCGFGYLADVTTVPIHRGKGLSLPLVHNAIHASSDDPATPSAQWKWCLLTSDAFWLYEKLGFKREQPRGMWLMPSEGPGVLPA